MFKREKELLKRMREVFKVLDQIEQHYRLIDPRTPEDVERIAVATENRLKKLVDDNVLSFIPFFEIEVKNQEASTERRTIKMPLIATIKINEMELMMAILHWKDPKESA